MATVLDPPQEAALPRQAEHNFVLGGPLRVTKAEIPKSVLREIGALAGPRPARFLLAAATTWGVIGGTIVVAALAEHWLVTLAAIFVIATRQHVLGYLMHEQAHHLAFRSRWGDTLANWLTAYPLLLVTTEGYAQVHLAHHQHYFTGDDPDHLRKSGRNWKIPMSGGHLLRLFLRDLLGMSVVALARGKRMEKHRHAYKRRGDVPTWSRPAFLLTVVAMLTVTGTWHLFLLYWIVPLTTVLQALIRWGALCEHEYNAPDASPEDTSPLIVLPWWQQLLMPNLNFNLHVYHHLFPNVSFSRLPRVHEIFAAHEWVRHERVFHGYGSYLAAILGRGR